jgi:hypothetical protein
MLQLSVVVSPHCYVMKLPAKNASELSTTLLTVWWSYEFVRRVSDYWVVRLGNTEQVLIRMASQH